MPGQDITPHLQGLTTDDVHIDSLGRAVITNNAVVSKLAQAGVATKPGTQAAGNIICTGSSPAAARELLQNQ
jgi:hypothetical protein